MLLPTFSMFKHPKHGMPSSLACPFFLLGAPVHGGGKLARWHRLGCTAPAEAFLLCILAVVRSVDCMDGLS
jgi:hypothetical protein